MSAATATTREQVLARIESDRAEHARRSLPLRVVTALAGALLGLVSVPLAIVLPEIGVPLLLVGLRLLAYEFAWAVRAYASVAWTWMRVKTWFAAKPGWVQALVLLALAAVAIGLLALVV